MDFDFNSDQALLAETLDRWSADHREIPGDARSAVYLDGAELARELAEQGFFDAAREPELGALGAIRVIEAAGRTPFAMETGASALVAPLLGLESQIGENGGRPLALMKAGGVPATRFLVNGGAALIDAGDHVRLLECGERVAPVKSPYAYPIGRFEGDAIAVSKPLDADITEFRRLRTLSIVAEALAAMEAALELTVSYVTSRVQFNRPIGSFQSVQHRLAECSALLQGVRFLLYRAATEGRPHEIDAAIVAHDAVKRVLYETTQFHGAIGLTLEYPLHLWTYRLRPLQIELTQAHAEPVSFGSNGAAA